VEQDQAENSDGDGVSPDTVVDVSALLKPLTTGPCIYRTKDWWTYEVI
jgi:hypothetical protein